MKRSLMLEVIKRTLYPFIPSPRTPDPIAEAVLSAIEGNNSFGVDMVPNCICHSQSKVKHFHHEDCEYVWEKE